METLNAPSWQPDLLFAVRGLAFYALDLRKSGRARRDGHTAHYVILALWLDHRRAAGRLAPVSALVLNSPWFDLQGKPSYRGSLTQALARWAGCLGSETWLDSHQLTRTADKELAD
jgi:alpha-beta hydrolase superfamily lysophospholipase